MVHELCISAWRECPADVILIIDHSGSMADYYTTVLSFTKKIVSGFELTNKTTRVGVIIFNENADIEVSER